MQERHLRIEQNPIDLRVIHVHRGDFNSRQGAATSVNEGQSFQITLTTTNVADGTNVPFTITGVSSADIDGRSLTGVFTVFSNTASVTINVTADNITD